MELHPDLFGADTPLSPEGKHGRETMLDMWVRIAHYRMELNNPNCCGNCEFHIIPGGTAGTYHKCRKLGVTGSSASDIRVKRVCDYWEAMKQS